MVDFVCPPKNMFEQSAQTSSLTNGGVDEQGKRPSREESSCDFNNFVLRIAGHAAVTSNADSASHEACMKNANRTPIPSNGTS
jgi:hypothetical protein